MRKRYQFNTTRRVLYTLLHFGVNDKFLNQDELDKLIDSEGFKLCPAKRERVINRLLTQGLVRIEGDYIRLTNKGLLHVEQQANILQHILYAWLTQHGSTTRKEFALHYANVVTRVTDEIPPLAQVMTILRILKRKKMIDFTTDKIWITKKVITM